MDKKVTVVITVYDTERYLTKCLDSVINQTLKDIEIIIVNDGSPDNSLNIIKEYQKVDERIVVFDIENKGVSNGRNLGLINARGKYIIFIDSDDYLNLDMIEIMYNKIISSNSDMAVCNFKRVFDNYAEKPFLKMPRQDIISFYNDNYRLISDIIEENIFFGYCVWNKLFKTELLIKSKVIFEERSRIYAEDAFFYLKVLKYIKKLCIIDKPLYNYYQRNTSISNTRKPNFTNRCINFVKEIEKYYSDLTLTRELAMRSYMFLIEILYDEIIYGNKYRDFKKVLKNDYFRNKVSNIKISNLSINRKLLYILYKHKMHFIIYVIFKISKERM